MSDGNYNRNLLPYNNYRSGLNAGLAQMKTRALAAFKAYYEKANPSASEEDYIAAKQAFASLLEG